jgi:hypothetical protein
MKSGEENYGSKLKKSGREAVRAGIIAEGVGNSIFIIIYLSYEIWYNTLVLPASAYQSISTIRTSKPLNI